MRARSLDRYLKGWRWLPFLVLFLAGAVQAASGPRNEIERLAATLAPGAYAELQSALPPGYKRFYDLLRVRLDDGRGMEIDGWTDAAGWDPERQRTFFIGQRKYKKFISYNAAANAWEELGWEGDGPPKFEEYGHTYGRTALDRKHGYFYLLAGDGLYRYAIDAARWEALSVVPIKGFISMQWHERLDALVAVSTGHEVYAFRDGRWDLLGQAAVHGYHSLGRYNRKRGDMLVAGGNESLRKVDLIDAAGKIHAMPDAPFDISIKDHALTYDPVSGNYLVLRRNQRQLYEFSPDAKAWRLAADWSEGGWPFGKYGFQVPIVIDEAGVILWQHETGPRLYRHRSVLGGDGAEIAPLHPAPSGRPQPVMPPPRGRAAANADADAEDEEGGGAPSADTKEKTVSARPPASGSSAPKPPAGAAPDPLDGVPRLAAARPITIPVIGPQAGPPPHAGPPPRLAAILAQMQPGEWRTIETALPQGYRTLFEVFRVFFCPAESGNTYGNGWMDSFVYDPDTKAFFAMMMRDSSQKNLIWLDAGLRWHIAVTPEGMNDCTYNHRAFNRLTLVDGWLYWPPAFWGEARRRTGEFRRARVRDFIDGGAVRFDNYGIGIGITSLGQAGDHAAEWFPELGGWIMHVAGNSKHIEGWSAPSGHTAEGQAEGKAFAGRVFLYHPGDREWTYLDRTYAQGFRSRLVYNPIRHEMLIAPGGYGPDDEFARITATGKVEKLDRARLDDGGKMRYHTSNNHLTWDPVSGDYLWWSYNQRRIWRSQDGRRWTVYDDFAGKVFADEGGLFGASSFIQFNAIPGSDGLIMFDPNRGVILHRMRRQESGGAGRGG